MLTFLSIILVIAAIVIIISVLMQEPKEGGLGVVDGSGTNLFGGASSGKDAVLSKITVGAFVVFLISAIAIVAIS